MYITGFLYGTGRVDIICRYLIIYLGEPALQKDLSYQDKSNGNDITPKPKLCYYLK